MKFSTISQTRLNTCHEDIRLILSEALKVSRVDFGVAEGHRSIERQQQLFKAGKSQKDGIRNLSKHNEEPSMAVDIYGWVNGKSCYDERTLCYLAGTIMAVAGMLYNQGRIQNELLWGGNWDGDGEIISDQKFQDLVHFEL
jgi:peptidoglycan L-alanyl-D-glutamate endopeptidase CwlK